MLTRFKALPFDSFTFIRPALLRDFWLRIAQSMVYLMKALGYGVTFGWGWGLFLGVAAVGDLAYDVTCDP